MATALTSISSTRRRGLAAPAPFWLLGLAAAVWVGAGRLLSNPGSVFAVLGDTDDATRLIQVREWLAGAAWFDPVLERIGAPLALQSHWSRLIDVPLGGLVRLFGQLDEPAVAEALARTVWPLLLFAALVAMLTRAAARTGGPSAAIAAAVLASVCFIGRDQFLPGRIDHHSVMIIGAVAGALLLVEAMDANGRRAWAAILAGTSFAIAITVGYEALPVAVLVLSVAAASAIYRGQSLDVLCRAMAACAAVLCAGLILSRPPSALFETRCDSLSINLVVFAAIAAGAVAATAMLAQRLSRAAQLALLAAGGIAALAAFVAIDPVCAGGPYAGMDARAAELWLPNVSETKSLWYLVTTSPKLGLAALAFLAGGIAAAIWLAETSRRPAAALAAGVLASVTVLGAWQVKFLPYAMFLAVVPLAVRLARPEGSDVIGNLARRMTTVPVLLLVIAGGLIAGGAAFSRAASPGATTAETSNAADACVTNASVDPLRALPTGLIAADLDLGPFIVALSDHRVVAAPYHRIGASIAELHEILGSDTGSAEARLRRIGANYVAVCAGLGSTTDREAASAPTLRSQLLSGKPPTFLEPVRLTSPTPLEVFRVRAAY